jgi:hypothetical protein
MAAKKRKRHKKDNEQPDVSDGKTSSFFLLPFPSCSLCLLRQFQMIFQDYTGRKSTLGRFPGRDAALRRPVGAARRPYQEQICDSGHDDRSKWDKMAQSGKCGGSVAGLWRICGGSLLRKLLIINNVAV